MKASFWLGFMFLMQISRLRFKQSGISMLIPHIYVLAVFHLNSCLAPPQDDALSRIFNLPRPLPSPYMGY